MSGGSRGSVVCPGISSPKCPCSPRCQSPSPSSQVPHTGELGDPVRRSDMRLSPQGRPADSQLSLPWPWQAVRTPPQPRERLLSRGEQWDRETWSGWPRGLTCDVLLSVSLSWGKPEKPPASKGTVSGGSEGGQGSGSQPGKSKPSGH